MNVDTGMHPRQYPKKCPFLQTHPWDQNEPLPTIRVPTYLSQGLINHINIDIIITQKFIFYRLNNKIKEWIQHIWEIKYFACFRTYIESGKHYDNGSAHPLL